MTFMHVKRTSARFRRMHEDCHLIPNLESRLLSRVNKRNRYKILLGTQTISGSCTTFEFVWSETGT